MEAYAEIGWYVRHDRDGYPRDSVWYVGPYSDEAEARAAAVEARAGRPIRTGPNGPIDSVEARRCAPRRNLTTAA